MGQKALARTLSGRESLARQALGLALLVLAMSTAYAVSGADVADSAEQEVEIVAEEPASGPAETEPRVDINARIGEVARRDGVERELVAAVVVAELRFIA